MSRKQPKRRAGSVASIAVAGIFILAVACGVGFGVASADFTDEIARAGAFGLDETTTNATRQDVSSSASRELSTAPSASYDQSALASTSARDISAGLALVDDLEEAERLRIEAENYAAFERMEAEKNKQGVTSTVSFNEAPDKDDVEYNLPAVNWSCGHEAFVSEWTERIDAYLSGSPLAGYGATFAEAAWDNGVDPRWSPAIANTESNKGSVCFRSHNAWGWGERSWSDWESAIYAHVAGLAQSYGYSITMDAARIYCPPNYVNWYANTIAQMGMI